MNSRGVGQEGGEGGEGGEREVGEGAGIQKHRVERDTVWEWTGEAPT